MTEQSKSNSNVLAEKLQTLENQLNQLQDQLVRAQRLAALGTMAGMIAHEFNNLLTPVVSYAQYALRRDDSELHHKALKQAYENGQKATEVAEQILGLARGNDNKSQAEIRETVETTIKSLGRNLEKDRIKLSVEVEPVVVSVQSQLLHQVLYNLVINARQAMLGRGGELTIRSTMNDGYVDVEVVDTGGGIDDETLPRIFDPFFTTKNDPEKSDMQGTGLGLAVSRYVIEQAGGTLTVESRPGQGCTFTVRLPLTESE